jgi:prolipoprotein diacylglyceryltransferase
MTMSHSIAEPSPAYPRYFKICGRWVNSYKVFLCIGIYIGVLVSAAVAQSIGISPLRMGLGGLCCAISGLAGARLYFLLLHADRYRQRGWKALWDPRSGGWSVFGALIPIIPLSFVMAWALKIPSAQFWDCMCGGILAGGFWVRLGCVFNGCCVGKETAGRLGVRLHDIHGVCKRRVPVQFLEMFWWLLGGALFLYLWPLNLRHGTYALCVLCWYGSGRFWLEPLRESPERLYRGLLINQLVAAILAISTGCGLLLSI